MRSSGKVLLGVLAGVAAGATLGILFAPDKGSNTRKKIVDKSNDYADDLTQRFNEFVDSMNQKVDSLTKDATHVAHNVNHQAEQLVDDVKSTMSNKY
jgi:gas vesicle protein